MGRPVIRLGVTYRNNTEIGEIYYNGAGVKNSGRNSAGFLVRMSSMVAKCKLDSDIKLSRNYDIYLTSFSRNTWLKDRSTG